MTSSATQARGGRQATWTRDNIIDALRRYAALYGDDFTASAFSPSTAKWRDEPEAVERYYAGDAEGNPWPSLNAVKQHFDGSFNAAREAAGLAPNKPGPGRRGRRKNGEHKPIRDVSHIGATRTVYVEKTTDTAKKEIASLRSKVARLEAQVERLRDAAPAKPVRVVKTKTKTKTVRVTDDRAVERAREKAARTVERAEAKLAEVREALDAARAESREARDVTTRLAARLERAEATIHSLRDERRELKDAARKSELAEDVARRELAEALAEAERLRNSTRVVVKDAPEQAAIDAALAEARDARGIAHSANERAARAERDYLELAAAVKGEPRRLSRAEIAELKAKGPAGPAVLAQALADLAKARKSNNPVLLRAALGAVMSAAATWQDRL